MDEINIMSWNLNRGSLIVHDRTFPLQTHDSCSVDTGRFVYVAVGIHHFKRILSPIYAPNKFEKI